MVRTQIQLTEEQARKARDMAHVNGISMAEFIRRAVDEALASGTVQSQARKRALNVIGCVRSGTGDLSEKHDEYLQEAYKG